MTKAFFCVIAFWRLAVVCFFFFLFFLLVLPSFWLHGLFAWSGGSFQPFFFSFPIWQELLLLTPVQWLTSYLLATMLDSFMLTWENTLFSRFSRFSRVQRKFTDNSRFSRFFRVLGALVIILGWLSCSCSGTDSLHGVEQWL